MIYKLVLSKHYFDINCSTTQRGFHMVTHTQAALKQQQLGRSLGAEAPLVMPEDIDILSRLDMPEGIDISLCLDTHRTDSCPWKVLPAAS